MDWNGGIQEHARDWVSCYSTTQAGQITWPCKVPVWCLQGSTAAWQCNLLPQRALQQVTQTLQYIEEAADPVIEEFAEDPAWDKAAGLFL